MEFNDLNKAERAALDDGLSLASRLVNAPRPLRSSHVQELYDALIANDQTHPEVEVALGLSFGELIAETTNFEWVRISDEYGEETCLSPKDIQLICSPISMIQKRLSAGENIDIDSLVLDTRKVVLEQVEKADYKRR